MKHLVVCVDGTWNTPGQEENGEPTPTNVYKLYRAVDTRGGAGVVQDTFYHTGVGTEGGPVSKVLDGAFGNSLGEHIQSAYFWLANNYSEDGDKDAIFLFGFSRGAFTVRSLAGMIGAVGLLNLAQFDSYAEKWTAVNEAYNAYRKKQGKLKKFKSDYSGKFFNRGQAVDIRFLGVWDTVGALGIPDDAELLNAIFDRKKRWEFHSTELSSHILTARHAMAMDEIRSSFTVTRWSDAPSHADAKEVWFPGVHSDVGGGYADTALSDVALQWMMEQAEQTGLKFHDVSAQLSPDPLGVIHNSYKGAFAALRSRPRNVPKIDKDDAQFHASVIQRFETPLIKYEPYRPTCSLDVGQSATVDVFAVQHWNYTGIYMNKGEKYEFSAQGEWVDQTDSCDWRGTEKDKKFTKGDVVRFFGSLWGKAENVFNDINKSTDFWGTKRDEYCDWFSMVGVISNDSGAPDPVHNDGSPTPHTYVSLPEHQHGKPLTIKAPGYFYAFANDAWHFYNNNKGSIRLTVTRVR